MTQNRPSRGMIYKRDGHKCQYCGATKSLTIDHVIPKSKGGDDSWENLVVACHSCNTKKSNKMLEETGMKLMSVPKAPFNKMELTLHKSNIPEWQVYCYT